ncbi:Uma2 family endonuclease [Nocardia sp. NPDC127579]|uniref:Uma2 family endonuclease n=1 Tax=Nocardia sp. NPDC127579 TaxID=3345402 RepID=UPI003634B901
MSIPHSGASDIPPYIQELPKYMTWDELGDLPDEVAGEIELWDGRVVWARTGSPAHQNYSVEFRNALKKRAADEAERNTRDCWRATTETNVFLSHHHKNDFLTPDFMVYRCLPDEFEYVHHNDVALVGEVESPSNTSTDIEHKKARYAAAGIPWYWHVQLSRHPRRVAGVTVFALLRDITEVLPGVSPLHPSNYIAIAEWNPEDDPDGIQINLPFPIVIPWEELEY